MKVKDEEVFRAKVRAWGASRGIVIPISVIKHGKIKSGSWVKFVIPKE